MIRHDLTTCSAWLIIAAAALVGGCTTVRETQPPRTATEQLLLSGAVIEAVDGMLLDGLNGKNVYFDTKYFKTVDQEFFLGEVRAKILKSGGRITDEKTADVIVEVRSGGLGIDKRDVLVGLPSFVIPIPGAGAFTTPEVPFMKDDRQKGMASVSITAYLKETGGLLFAIGPSLGRTVKSKFAIFGFTINRQRTNVPDDLD